VTSVEISPTAEPQVSETVAVETAPAAAPAPKGRQKPKVQTLPRKKIVKVLSVGMEVTGKVKRVSEYGAFVDIGVGRDGLLHISELSTSRVRKVDDMIKEGDEINVWIKELDREKNRISLTMVPPGTKTIRDLAVGELVTGSVQRLTSYGAFVDIGMERDAMLHVKEMGDGYVAKPEDVVKVGDEIEARISGVDARRGRVDLSLKGLRPTTGSGGFPTRSHAHAWSSAPSRFLNRIVLGIKDTSPGAATVQISPRLNGLTWARGATATARGPVSVCWKLDGNTLNVNFSAPSGVETQFVKNDTHRGLTVIVNGEPH